jgi:HD-GYP domain-containing protein (c-di-GMP phosphodiesterase class II)
MRCRHCHALLDGELHLRVGEEFCCEACRLNELRASADPASADDLYAAFAETLAATLDARECETGQHSKRVACHTQVLARRFTGDPADLRQIYWGALLHDLGKIGVPDAVLLKQGPLDGAEWEVMKSHVETGYRLVSTIPGMADAAVLVLNHEERFDGRGYPRGLAGDAIPLSARLFAVIDTLDAMTSDRPYRKGLGFDAAKEEIRRQSGTQFDPVAVDAFLAEEDVLRKMVELKCSLPRQAAGQSG